MNQKYEDMLQRLADLHNKATNEKMRRLWASLYNQLVEVGYEFMSQIEAAEAAAVRNPEFDGDMVGSWDE